MCFTALKKNTNCIVIKLLQTLCGNPKGLVELNNLNTSAEVKLHLFIFSCSRKACRQTEVLKYI